MFFLKNSIKLILAAIIVIFTANAVSAQKYSEYSSFLGSASTRVINSLNGKWEMSYDDIEWREINVPYSNPEERVAYYRRTIKIEKNIAEKHTWQLHFFGIDDYAEIYVNGQYVDRVLGGMTWFSIKIPDKFFDSNTNTIKLVVNPATHSSRRIRVQNIYPKKIYTGIIRDVFLVGTPRVWIGDILSKITYDRKQSIWRLNASVNISAGDFAKSFGGADSDSMNIPGGEKTRVSYEAELIDNSGNRAASFPMNSINIEKERTQTEKISMGFSNPILWSPENPYLYTLKIKLTVGGRLLDEKYVQVGFKSVRTANTKGGSSIMLNGKKIKVKGVIYIEDIFGRGQTLSDKEMLNDINKIKTLGANVIRFKYSPPDPYFAYLCDKYGILMMIELPVYEVPSSLLTLDEIKVRMKNTAKRYINTYNNHASLFAWGVSEGIQEDLEESTEFFGSLSKVFKQSSDKLLYKTILFGSESLDTKGFDFISIFPGKNRYSFDYFKNSITKLQSLAENIPIIVTYGLPIQPNNINGYSDPLSVESQAYYIRNSFHIVNELKCAGSIINSFNDYELNSPLLIVDHADQYLLSTGLTSRNREQRLSFASLQSLFNNEKEPLLNAGSYKEETPVLFIFVGIFMGVILVIMINRFRRFREYLFRSVLRPYNFYADIRDQRIMSLVQTVLLGLVISFTVGIFLSSVFYYYRSNMLIQFIYMALMPSAVMQEVFYRIIWLPGLLMVCVSLAVFAVSVISAFIIRIFAFFVKSRIFFQDALTIVVWAGVPLIMLLPLSIILIRLLVFSPTLNIVVLIIMVLLYGWVLIRIMRSTSVVFDVPSLRVYLVGFLFIFISSGIVLSLYQFQYSIFAYAQYFMDVMMVK